MKDNGQYMLQSVQRELEKLEKQIAQLRQELGEELEDMRAELEKVNRRRRIASVGDRIGIAETGFDSGGGGV